MSFWSCLGTGRVRRADRDYVGEITALEMAEDEARELRIRQSGKPCVCHAVEHILPLFSNHPGPSQ